MTCSARGRQEQPARRDGHRRPVLLAERRSRAINPDHAWDSARHARAARMPRSAQRGKGAHTDPPEITSALARAHPPYARQCAACARNPALTGAMLRLKRAGGNWCKGTRRPPKACGGGGARTATGRRTFRALRPARALIRVRTPHASTPASADANRSSGSAGSAHCSDGCVPHAAAPGRTVRLSGRSAWACTFDGGMGIAMVRMTVGYIPFHGILRHARDHQQRLARSIADEHIRPFAVCVMPRSTARFVFDVRRTGALFLHAATPCNVHTRFVAPDMA